MERKDLLSSNEFWLTLIQNKIFNLIEDYRNEHKLNRTQIAEKLGVTKGYVSQMLNGDYDHKISKMASLALAFNKVPVVNFIDLDEVLKFEEMGFNILDAPVFIEAYDNECLYDNQNGFNIKHSFVLNTKPAEGDFADYTIIPDNQNNHITGYKEIHLDGNR